MCTVSMVVGGWTTPYDPNYVPFTKQSPDPGTALQMLEILRKLDELDKKLGALDCKVEAKKKAKFVKKLEKRAGL